jgi:hypothetical protein
VPDDAFKHRLADSMERHSGILDRLAGDPEWRTGELDWMYRALRLARLVKHAGDAAELVEAREHLDRHLEAVPA